MLTPFLTGALAGYGIAMPVGPISVLIIELGIRRGLRIAAAAGLGTATADAIYASVAVVAGSGIAGSLEPYAPALKAIAVVALLGIAARGLLVVARRGRTGAVTATVSTSDARRTYVRFLAITILNPQTILYFGALILGRPDLGDGIAERGAFVVGAAAASTSWQLLLAALGALAHRRLPARAQLALSVVGNLVVIGFALVIASTL